MFDPAAIHDWLIAIFSIVWGVIAAILAWFMNRNVSQLDDMLRQHDDRLDEHDKSLNTLALDHANFKTHVSDNYAKEATTQQSLARIHDRIDKLPWDIVSLIKQEK